MASWRIRFHDKWPHLASLYASTHQLDEEGKHPDPMMGQDNVFDPSEPYNAYRYYIQPVARSEFSIEEPPYLNRTMYKDEESRSSDYTSGDSFRRGSTCRVLLCVSLVLSFIGVVVAAITLAVLLSKSPRPAKSALIQPEIFESQASLLGQDFNEKLLDTESEEFKKLSAELCVALEQIFTDHDSPVRHEFAGCEVVEFSNGSVQAVFRIKLLSKRPDGFKEEERILQKLEEHFAKKIRQTGPWQSVKFNPDFLRRFIKIAPRPTTPATTVTPVANTTTSTLTPEATVQNVTTSRNITDTATEVTTSEKTDETTTVIESAMTSDDVRRKATEIVIETSTGDEHVTEPTLSTVAGETATDKLSTESLLLNITKEFTTTANVTEASITGEIRDDTATANVTEDFFGLIDIDSMFANITESGESVTAEKVKETTQTTLTSVTTMESTTRTETDMVTTTATTDGIKLDITTASKQKPTSSAVTSPAVQTSGRTFESTPHTQTSTQFDETTTVSPITDKLTTQPPIATDHSVATLTDKQLPESIAFSVASSTTEKRLQTTETVSTHDVLVSSTSMFTTAAAETDVTRDSISKNITESPIVPKHVLTEVNETDGSAFISDTAEVITNQTDIPYESVTDIPFDNMTEIIYVNVTDEYYFNETYTPSDINETINDTFRPDENITSQETQPSVDFMLKNVSSQDMRTTLESMKVNISSSDLPTSQPSTQTSTLTDESQATLASTSSESSSPVSTVVTTASYVTTSQTSLQKSTVADESQTTIASTLSESSSPVSTVQTTGSDVTTSQLSTHKSKVTDDSQVKLVQTATASDSSTSQPSTQASTLTGESQATRTSTLSESSRPVSTVVETASDVTTSQTLLQKSMITDDSQATLASTLSGASSPVSTVQTTRSAVPTAQRSSQTSTVTDSLQASNASTLTESSRPISTIQTTAYSISTSQSSTQTSTATDDSQATLASTSESSIPVSTVQTTAAPTTFGDRQTSAVLTGDTTAASEEVSAVSHSFEAPTMTTQSQTAADSITRDATVVSSSTIEHPEVSIISEPSSQGFNTPVSSTDAPSASSDTVTLTTHISQQVSTGNMTTATLHVSSYSSSTEQDATPASDITVNATTEPDTHTMTAAKLKDDTTSASVAVEISSVTSVPEHTGKDFDTQTTRPVLPTEAFTAVTATVSTKDVTSEAHSSTRVKPSTGRPTDSPSSIIDVTTTETESSSHLDFTLTNITTFQEVLSTSKTPQESKVSPTHTASRVTITETETTSVPDSTLKIITRPPPTKELVDDVTVSLSSVHPLGQQATASESHKLTTAASEIVPIAVNATAATESQPLTDTSVKDNTTESSVEISGGPVTTRDNVSETVINVTESGTSFSTSSWSTTVSIGTNQSTTYAEQTTTHMAKTDDVTVGNATSFVEINLSTKPDSGTTEQTEFGTSQETHKATSLSTPTTSEHLTEAITPSKAEHDLTSSTVEAIKHTVSTKSETQFTQSSFASPSTEVMTTKSQTNVTDFDSQIRSDRRTEEAYLTSTETVVLKEIETAKIQPLSSQATRSVPETPVLARESTTVSVVSNDASRNISIDNPIDTPVNETGVDWQSWLDDTNITETDAQVNVTTTHDNVTRETDITGSSKSVDVTERPALVSPDEAIHLNVTGIVAGRDEDTKAADLDTALKNVTEVINATVLNEIISSSSDVTFTTQAEGVNVSLVKEANATVGDQPFVNRTAHVSNTTATTATTATTTTAATTAATATTEGYMNTTDYFEFENATDIYDYYNITELVFYNATADTTQGEPFILTHENVLESTKSNRTENASESTTPGNTTEMSTNNITATQGSK